MTHPARLEPGAIQLLADLEQAGALTPTGLNLTDPNLSYERAEAIGFLLGRMDDCIKFAIGDWLVFIEQVFPQTWPQMAEALNLSENRRREYMRVSERVAKSRRRVNVCWSQHRAVAPLPPTEQKEWLKRIDDERLSHHALRDALRNGKPPDIATHCRCCGASLVDA